MSTIVLALLFQIALNVIEQPEAPLKGVLVFDSAPWYLISLACWYLLVPFFTNIRPAAGLAISFVIALGAGCFEDIGTFLSLSRTLTFLPYFLLGFYCPKPTLERVRSSKAATACAVCALAFAAFYALRSDLFSSFIYLTSGNRSYRGSNVVGVCQYALIFAIAIVLSLGAVRIAPSKRTFLARWGERTLPIYVLHRILRGAMKGLGFFDLPILLDPALGTAIIFALSVGITELCALPVLKKPFDAIMNARWPRLVAPREKNAAA